MVVLWIIHCVVFSFLFYKLCDFDHIKLVTIRNHYAPSTKIAQSLFSELISFRVNNQSGKCLELPKYKYFTKIIEDLIRNTRLYGTPIQATLIEIKTALSKDIVFEKKISSSIGGGLYQMVLVATIGFLFLYITKLQLNLIFPITDLVNIVIFQLVGIILFVSLSYKLKVYHFAKLEHYIQTLYIIRSLNQANIPISKVYNKVCIDSLSENKKLKPFKDRVLSILESIKNYGELGSENFEITINELWQSSEFQFDLFLSHLAALKLIVLVVFFLGSFLYMLMYLSSHLSL